MQLESKFVYICRCLLPVYTNYVFKLGFKRYKNAPFFHEVRNTTHRHDKNIRTNEYPRETKMKDVCKKELGAVFPVELQGGLKSLEINFAHCGFLYTTISQRSYSRTPG